MNDDKCLRCGKCCHFIEKGEIKPCKLLRKMSDGRYRCLRYYDRHGVILAKGWTCIDRKDVKFDFPGCPFNSNKPLFPEMIK